MCKSFSSYQTSLREEGREWEETGQQSTDEKVKTATTYHPKQPPFLSHVRRFSCWLFLPFCFNFFLI